MKKDQLVRLEPRGDEKAAKASWAPLGFGRASPAQVIQSRLADGLTAASIVAHYGMSAGAPVQTKGEVGPSESEAPHASAQRSPIQRAEKQPELGGSNKATSVTLTLEAGDWPQAGQPTKGNEDIAGIAAVSKLGLKFVRFHVLNAESGGRPVPDNLTPTSQTVNQSKKWKDFETEEKKYIASGQKVGDKTVFDAAVSYHPDKEVVAVGKGRHGGKKIPLNDGDYPSQIAATVTKKNQIVASETLDGDGDGLSKPSTNFGLAKIPYYEISEDPQVIEDASPDEMVGHVAKKKKKTGHGSKPY